MAHLPATQGDRRSAGWQGGPSGLALPSGTVGPTGTGHDNVPIKRGLTARLNRRLPERI